MPTISGPFFLPGKTNRFRGVWTAVPATADGSGVVADPDGALRGGAEDATDNGEGATLVLPAGWYDVTWRSLDRVGGRQVLLGPWRYNLTADTTWGAILDAQPGGGPLTPSQYQELRDLIDSAGFQTVDNGDGTVTVVRVGGDLGDPTLVESLLNAAAAAEDAADRAEAVPTTTDALMKAIDGNASSLFRQQADARQSAAYAPLLSTGAASMVNNLIPDPIASETGLWTASNTWPGGGAATRSILPTGGFKGTGALEHRLTTASTASGENTGPNLNPSTANAAPVSSDKPYADSLYVEVGDTPGDVRVQALVFYFDAAKNFLGQFGAAGVQTIRRNAGPQRLYCPTTRPPANAAFYVPSGRVWSAAELGTGWIRVSAPQVEQGITTAPFRHGDMPNAFWSGTRRASTSTALRGVCERISATGPSHIGSASGGGYNLAVLLGDACGREVLDRGRGGETSTGIAIRNGAVVPRVTFPDNSIPSGGAAGPVTVDIDGPVPAVFRGGTAWQFFGEVSGVDGILTRGATGTWTFQPNTSRAAATPVGAALAWIAYDTAVHVDTSIFQAGENNVSPDVAPTQASADRAIYDLGLMAAKALAEGREYVILPVYNIAGEGLGTSKYALIKGMNDRLAAAHGPRFLDTRRWLIDNGLTVLGITPTNADLTAIAEDRFPPSLLPVNDFHLSPAARRAVAAWMSVVMRSRNLLRCRC